MTQDSMQSMNINNNADFMKAEEQYIKLFAEADIGTKFVLKCWLDFCRQNKPISFKNYQKTQTINKLLDKLHYGIVAYDDIGSEDEVEKGLYLFFGGY